MLSTAEKFIKLRRCHPGTGEHGMHLAAMMDLVLEQMQQQSDTAIALHRCLAQDRDRPLQRRLVLRIEVDLPAVDADAADGSPR